MPHIRNSSWKPDVTPLVKDIAKTENLDFYKKQLVVRSNCRAQMAGNDCIGFSSNFTPVGAYGVEKSGFFDFKPLKSRMSTDSKSDHKRV